MRHPASLFTALTCGTSAVLLGLYALAALAASRLAAPWSHAAAALDPARIGSLPELWAGLQLLLLIVMVVACAGRLGCRCLWRAALVPLALLGADLTDAGACLASLLASPAVWPYGPAPGILAAKLLADLLVGSVALAPVLLPWRCSCMPKGRLVLLPVLGGAVSLGLDLVGTSSAGEAGRHLLASIEEGAELLLYSVLAGMVFERAVAGRKEKVSKRDISPLSDALPTRRQASCREMPLLSPTN